MKTIFFSVLSLFLISHITFSQNADAILGDWFNAEKDGKIRIYKSGNLYFGKLIWGKELYEADGKTSRKDVNNTNALLKGRPLLNLPILEQFEFYQNEWRNGKVYDPKSGKTYDGFLKLKDGKLEIRGYVGIAAFGKTTVWTKAQ